MRRQLAAFGSIAVLMAGCGGSAVQSTSPTPSSASPPEASAAVSPSAAETLTPSSGPGEAPSLAWVEHPFEGDVYAVTADGDRFVAVGGMAAERAAWTSIDGVTWERLAVPPPSTAHCDAAEPICLERSAGMGPMVRLDDTLYSFGATEFFNDYIKAVGWRWTDGQDWQVIESENAIYAGGAFRAAAASDSSIFAVTHAGYPFTERHWLWKPDTSWVQVGQPISTDNPIEFRAVAWRDGLFLAAGARWDADEDVPSWEWDEVPAIWSSTDGTTWLEVPVPDDGSALCGMVSTPDSFFITGLGGQGDFTVWRSEDGGDWRAGVLPGAPSPEPVAELACGNVAGGVVANAGGYLAFAAVDDQTLTWASQDGLAWVTATALDSHAGAHHLAAIDGTVVAFGSRGQLGEVATQSLSVGTWVADTD